MTIFYNQKIQTLIINIQPFSPNKIVTKDSYSIIYKDNEIIGLNLFNIALNQKSGFVMFNNEISKLVEQITNIKLAYSPNFIVAHVQSCDDIPKTHLHKCVLTDGHNQYDVICGANNIRSDVNVVFAKNGAILPNGQQISSGELMGYKSEGMICSYKELNIQNPNNLDGIIILDDKNYQIGEEFRDFFTKQN